MRLTRVRGGVAVNLLSAGWCLWPRNERRQRSSGPVVDGGPADLKRVLTSANISSKLCEHRLVHRPCRCGGRRYSCPTPPAGVLKPSESVLMKRLRQRSAPPHLARTGPVFAILLILPTATACGSEPPRAETPLEERTPKVLLIGIDGVRADVLADVSTPNIDALAAAGSFTAQTRTTTPSVSGPAWSSMLTGVWPEKHGVTSNRFINRQYEQYPDFLTRIEQIRPELATFAVVDWLPLGQLDGAGGPTLSARIDVREVLDGSELGWADADTRSVGLAVQHITQADPDAMFVYLGNPDETSHEHQSIGVEYRDAIALSDRHVGMLIDAIRARPLRPSENWLILVSTDHGRLPDGGHGGDSRIEMTTFILTSGPSAAVGTPAGPTFIVDLAVTALTHLGVSIDPAWELDGKPVGLR